MTISEKQTFELIHNIGLFLKAFTKNTMSMSQDLKGTQKPCSYKLYSGFIIDYLLKSHSQDTVYLGLSVLKNMLDRQPKATAKMLVQIEEFHKNVQSPLELLT